MPRVISVNVARARPVVLRGRRTMTAIAKQPVQGDVALRPMGLEGDEQADLSVHGGLAKAVYLYPHEHYAGWAEARHQQLGLLFDDLAPGFLGENLTTEGLLEAELWIGDRLQLPNACLMVSEPRFPCFKLAARMELPQAAKRMAATGHCGAYLSVVDPGTIRAGDPIELLPGRRDVRLLDVFLSKVRP